VVHTHHLTVSGDEVRKRFESWDRGEADRESAGLTTLARHIPDLAPTPLAFETEGGAPVVVMSRVSGEPLGEAALTAAQTHALATTLRRLFGPGGPGPWRAGLPTVGHAVRDPRVCRSGLRPRGLRDPILERDALDAAREWLSVDDPSHDQVVDAVFAVGDGSLANVLWDGHRCRLVDFEEFGVSDLA
jgi:aminoglycoside phosphotransferase (APT) family kinase protein